MERFQGGLVFQAHRVLCYSTLGSRVIKKKQKKCASGVHAVSCARESCARVCSTPAPPPPPSPTEWCEPHLLYIYLSIYLYVSISIYQSIYLSMCVCVCIYIYIYICIYICIYMYMIHSEIERERRERVAPHLSHPAEWRRGCRTPRPPLSPFPTEWCAWSVCCLGVGGWRLGV